MTSCIEAVRAHVAAITTRPPAAVVQPRDVLLAELHGTNARGWRTPGGDVVLAADVGERVVYVVGAEGEERLMCNYRQMLPRPVVWDLHAELAAAVVTARAA